MFQQGYLDAYTGHGRDGKSKDATGYEGGYMAGCVARSKLIGGTEATTPYRPWRQARTHVLRCQKNGRQPRGTTAPVR